MGKVLFSELSALNPNIVPILRGKGLLCALVVRPQGSKPSHMFVNVLSVAILVTVIYVQYVSSILGHPW